MRGVKGEGQTKKGQTNHNFLSNTSFFSLPSSLPFLFFLLLL